MQIDPHVVAELTSDDFEFENPTDDLDDDFVLQANGGELPVLPPPISISLRKNEFRVKAVHSDDDSNEEMDFNSSYDDHKSEKDIFVHIENKGGLIDEQFDKLYEEYNETEDENEEAEEFLLDPSSDRMKMLVEDFKKKRVELVLQKDVLSHCYPETNDEALEVDEQMEKITIICPKKKKIKWDCETAVSAYSNIYNRPAVIVDSSRKQKLKSVLRQIEVCLL